MKNKITEIHKTELNVDYNLELSSQISYNKWIFETNKIKLDVLKSEKIIGLN